MDYQKFIEQLPHLYENWGQESIRPKSQKFQEILDGVEGMTTDNIMQLLNCAVGCMEPDEIYCEVGSYQGKTLIGALLDRPGTISYAIDNFSEFNPRGNNQEKLQEHLNQYNLTQQVRFYNQDFEEFFWEQQANGFNKKIGVYLYDGPHDYRSQMVGLLLVKPFLSPQALLIVDDANYADVQQADWDFVAAHPECNLLLERLTPENYYSTFWNGIHLLSWDVEKSHERSHPLERIDACQLNAEIQ